MSKKIQGSGLRVRESENRILLAFLLNMIFTFVEVWGSAATGSVTILSDAIHDFGDCIALGMAWRMEKLSKRAANGQYNFGYGRFSVVAGLVNNLILLLGGVVLIITSLQRFLCPREINGKGMLLFAVFGIVINGSAMLLTARGKNINEKTISMHMLEDVLTWMAVLIVGAVMCFYDLPILDSLLSIGMTLVIFAGVAKNLKKIFGVLTVRCPMAEQEYKTVWKQLDALNPVGGLEELRLFSMNGEDLWGEVCLVLYEDLSPEDNMRMVTKVRECCELYGISRVTIQCRREGCVAEESMD